MIQNNILKLMWSILKLKVGDFETGSNLSPCDPFVSNQQLEPQGLIFTTYIFKFIEKKCVPLYHLRHNFIKKYAPLPTIPMNIVRMGS